MSVARRAGRNSIRLAKQGGGASDTNTAPTMIMNAMAKHFHEAADAERGIAPNDLGMRTLRRSAGDIMAEQ